MNSSGGGVAFSPKYVPKHQADEVLTQAAAVQNTWYTVLDTVHNVRIYELTVKMSTLAEDIEFRVTIDGNTYSGTQAAAIADQLYYLYLRTVGGATPSLLTPTATAQGACIGGGYIEARSFKFEVRKTSANGANTLNGAVMYAKW